MAPNPRKLRAKTIAFQREVLDKMSALATAAFGLVAALAWNNAIQAVFQRYYPAPGVEANPTTQIGPLVVYALIITIIAVAVILGIGRLAGRLKAEAEELAGAAEAG
ncbi:MAG TPA: DUF5654 family protein [Candidatus Thermoplasmatota archaeon]|nr:DUF5654 family protein [Candidatus Thermoplasmatota archaeon]